MDQSRRRRRRTCYYSLYPVLCYWMVLGRGSLVRGRGTQPIRIRGTVPVPQRQRHAQLVSVAGFSDSEGCYESMINADENNDQMLSATEYVQFVSDLINLPLGNDFADLPVRFILMFNLYACGSAYCDNDACCNPAQLQIPDSPNTTGDGNYFYNLCRLGGPTAQPTVAPVMAPTRPPTGAPVRAPTTAPVVTPPTVAPVVDPTRVPTVEPTFMPPTAAPTLSPITNAPTLSPTLVPTIAPNPLPTTLAPITAAPVVTSMPTGPTAQPTMPPTMINTILIKYDIAIRDGRNLLQDASFQQEYRLQLIKAVNEISDLVVSEDSLQRQQRRVLQVVAVRTPTNIPEQRIITCPSNRVGINVEADTCESISHEVSVVVRDGGQLNTFQSDLERAINSNLQRQLDNASWSSTNGNPILYINGLPRIAADRSLGPAAIGGITGGGILLLILPIAYFLYHRKRKRDSDHKEYMANVKDDIEEMDGGGGPPIASDARTDAAARPTPSLMLTTGTLGAAHANYGKNHHTDAMAEPGMLDDEEASSNAGSSGWSSSAGISSLNTGSVDDEGATLAGLGVASAFSRNLTESDQEDPPDRGQLDALIESGDWAAVGATAALLAAASDSQSEKSSSRADSQSADAARAAELDHLVDAGDWEGVVTTAAKFESQGSTGTGTGSHSRTNSSMESGSGSATGQSTKTSSVSDSPSRTMKRQEVRAEVEALVRRVVPEEIDNVDEMMNQFKGREEELIETLRTMQERAVAQKARAAGHKAAKQEARRNVKSSRGAANATSGAVVRKVTMLEIKEAAAGTGGASSAGVGITAAASPRVDKKNARMALEDAIEAGDWDAVGEAAGMISDSSVTTADTAEIQRLAGTNLSLSTTESRRSHMSGIQAERAAELDQLIDSGDWSGVAKAAKSFRDSDRRTSVGKSAPSKEEEDALKEAEEWMRIAEQTKGKGRDSGAVDAAEWAIQRSLTQLKKAETKSSKKTEEDEV